MSDNYIVKDSVLDQIIKGEGLIAKPVQLEGFESYTVIPAGLKLESLKHLRLTPRRVEELVTLSEAPSFCTYVQRFKTDSTIIQAQRHPNGLGAITAIIDYHQGTDPKWCAHKAYLPLQLHRRFQEWVNSNNKPMTQTQFAEWLDERILDIATPPGADMVEMVQWLEATSNASFKQVINLTNGRTSFAFSDPMKLEVKGTEAELPRVIGLLLPIVEGGADVAVNVQLRYRLESDRLKLFYRIPNLADILEKEWLEVTAAIEKKLALPFYRVR